MPTASPRVILFVLQMVNFAGNSGYSILVPLYPPLAKEKGISDSVIGYIFSLYPVGGFIVSIILGSFMTVQTMKQIMLVGLILTMLGMTGMGLVAYIEDKLTFILVSGMLRLLTGIGATCCFTPSYGMAGYLFKEDLLKVISQLQVMSGIATFSGPLLGSLFYVIGEQTPIGGFSMPMYILSFIYLLTVPLLIIFLQVEVKDIVNYQYPNNKVSVLIQEGFDEVQWNMKEPLIKSTNKQSRQSLLSAVVSKLTYYRVFKIRGVVLVFASHVILFTASLGVRTFFSLYLQESYGFSNVQSTLVFLISTTIRGFTSLTLGRYKNLNKRLMLSLGLMIISLGYFFYGPDTAVTGLPHQVWAICVADGLWGLGWGVYSLCIISEYMSDIRERYPNCNEDVNGMASAIYVIGWTIGEFTGPLVGGNLMDYYSFERVSSIFGFVMVANTLVYFLFYLNTRPNTKTEALPVDENETKV